LHPIAAGETAPTIAANGTLQMDTAGANKNVTADTTAYTLSIPQAGVYQIAYGGIAQKGAQNGGRIALMNNQATIDESLWNNMNSTTLVYTGKVLTVALVANSVLSLVNNSIGGVDVIFNDSYIEVVKLDDAPSQTR
jgi:hypothetical protein